MRGFFINKTLQLKKKKGIEEASQLVLVVKNLPANAGDVRGRV